MSLIVCIDPGHGLNYNPGANSSYYEGNRMFDLGKLLKAELEKYDGITVLITRNTVEDDPSLASRGAMAVSGGAKLFISLHTDACNDENVNRVSVYRSINLPRSEDLGKKLMNAIVGLIGSDIHIIAAENVLTRKNSAGNADYYGVIRNSAKGPVKASFIVEHGFHTNYSLSTWMMDDDNLKKLAALEATIIAEYYGCLKVTNSNTKKNNTSVSIGNKKNNVITTTSNSIKFSNTFINYTVVNGDSWWKIAEKKLGDGTKYKELAEYNKRSATSPLLTGQVIKIPSNMLVKKYKEYTVKKGDNWWKIAVEQMGDGSKYRHLASYNGKSSSDALLVGQVLKIPNE